jgi:hypothetical protein
VNLIQKVDSEQLSYYTHVDGYLVFDLATIEGIL